MTNVRIETLNLMRELGMTTVFGNPGSTEENFLKEFPSDLTYILALQEASVLAMADGFAQATGRAAFVNVHTAPGLGNAMGNLIGAWHNKTPLIVTAGQQTREMLLLEPWLTNVNATMLPQPYVKWSYEVSRAQDIPAALMRAYATAMQPPCGPVFLSLPLDDWEQPSSGAPVVRGISTRVAPDPARLRDFADQLSASRNPALVIGADVDRSNGWPSAVALAEKTGAAVYAPPGSERAGFPEDHPQFHGALLFATGPLSQKLQGHDLVVVIGAPVFRYYPYMAGSYLPEGTRLLHITNDPNEAARAPVGDSLIGDSALALSTLVEQVSLSTRAKPPARPQPAMPTTQSPMSADDLFAALARVRPDDMVLVEESPSNLATLHKWLPITKPNSFFTMASGGLGFGLPASVGVALGERETKRNRPVMAVIGDGSFQYSIQSLWTAAQHKTPLVIVVPRNDEYAILKSFAQAEDTPGVPGLDQPGINIALLARGYGCQSQCAETPDEVSDAVRAAFAHDGPTVIEVPISPAPPPLL